MGLPKVQAISRPFIIFAIYMEMFVGYSARNMRVVQYCAKDLFFGFSFFFFQRNKERMTLSAIRPDGGEKFRLCVGLLQHLHFFSFFFKFQHKVDDCRCTRIEKRPN